MLGQLPPTVYAPRLSPDGRRIAFETRDRSGPDVAGAINWAPMWSPDGLRLVFIVSSELGDAV